MVFAWDDSDRGGEEQSHTFGTAWQYPPHRLAARHRLAAATAAAPTSSDASSLMSSSLASRWSNTNGFPDVALDTTKIVSLLGTDGLPWATAGTTTPAKAGLDDVGTDGTVGGIPLYPRRLWSVSDTKLPRFPSTWPQPVNAVQVDRSTPAAVIAIRIASCLARRSVAVDYDDDAATAYGVTIDQCHLAVHLWRRPKRNGAGPDDGELLDTDTVMVECRRIRGSVQTFHRTAVAIFEAAQGLDSGADRRSLHQTAPTEYPRLLGQASFASLHSIARSGDLDGAEMDSSSEARESASDEISDSQMAMEALELAFSFLGKDRWDAQSWGMYCLATLVDASVTRKSVAICAALRLLAATDTGTSTTTSADKDSNSLILQQLQTNWIFNIIVTRQLPSEKDLQKEVDPYAFLTAPEETSAQSSTKSGHDEDDKDNADDPQSALMDGSSDIDTLDDQHARQMRSLALRVITNALQLAADEEPSRLQSVLSTTSPSCWISRTFLSALGADLQGASRPACLSAGRWSTPHDAALAAKCLGILALSSKRASAIMKCDNVLLSQLEKVTAIGRSTHAVLAAEARRTYLLLTEEDRSC
jgi:hypothetical protein